MRVPLIAGGCGLLLLGTLVACSETGPPEPASPSFARMEIDGVTTDHASTGGVSWVDYDADGDLDLFVTNGYDVSAPPAGQTNRLHRNDGAEGFVLVTEGTLATSAGISSGHTWGDYDNDGDLDVYVTNQQDEDNLLFRNEGGGVFTQVTGEPPTADGGHSYTATWVDIDQDGWLDLFVANGGMSHVGANAMYRNLGDGHLERVTEGEIVTDQAATCGLAWGDYDDDGDLDLFVANNGFAPPGNNNALYRNDGDWSFTKIADSPVVQDGLPASSATWVDVDNDLDLDLHVANMYGVAARLYLNDGSGTLTPASFSSVNLDAGHVYGVDWQDYDNDGDLDVLVANWGAAPALHRNDGRGIFERVSAGDLGAHIEHAGAIASADVDGDGRIDVCVGNWPNAPGPTERNAVYRNRSGSGHWLRIHLVGTVSNRSAIGARVTVSTPASVQARTVVSQAGFRGQSDLDCHFGLGTWSGTVEIEIRWPGGGSSVLESVGVDQVLTVTEPGAKKST